MKYIILAVFGFLALGILGSSLWIMGTYNTLVTGDEIVETTWAEVETNYQRRFDLIPGLVESTKGIFNQEQEVFKAIAEARTRYSNTEANSNERVEATSGLNSSLARLMVIVENYPELKSNQQVTALMDELAGTENRIQIARIRYNEAVQDWNISIKKFPRSILAGMFGFEPRTRFESEEGSEKAVKVDLIN